MRLRVALKVYLRSNWQWYRESTARAATKALLRRRRNHPKLGPCRHCGLGLGASKWGHKGWACSRHDPGQWDGVW